MSGSQLPTLMDASTDEEFTAKTLRHARLFSIIRVVRGGYRSGKSNYERHEAPTLEEARTIAERLRKEDNKNTVIIYAIADFAGANGFSRPVEFYPKSEYLTRADREKIAKQEKREMREKLREARNNLGSKHFRQTVIPTGFYDASEPLAYVTDD